MEHPERELISVVVPIRNKAPLLERCLGSLVTAAHQDANTELIFVDNRSTDGSGEILASRFAGLATLCQSKAPNAAGVRNDGVRLSGGEILSFLDADCEIPPDYFARLRTVFAHEWITATGCAVEIPTNRSWVEREWYRLHHRGTDGIRPYLNSGNFAVRRQAFVQIAGFDESLETGEDSNLGERLTAAGFSILEHSSLRVVHLDNPTTLWAFFRKEIWHAKGMFGSVGFGHLDRPTVLTIAHLVLTLLGIGALFTALAANRVELTALSLTSIAVVPTLSVSYRRVLAKNPGAIFPAFLLYEVYFLARCTALIRIIARSILRRASLR